MTLLDTLFRKHAEPIEEEDIEDDDEREMRLIEIGLHTGIGRPHDKPLEFSASLPAKQGLYLIREPGAPRLGWKVVDVVHNGRELRASWTDIESRPLHALAGWEFARIQEPRQ